MKAEAAGISKKVFLALTKQKQKKYLKQYPKSTHRFLIGEHPPGDKPGPTDDIEQTDEPANDDGPKISKKQTKKDKDFKADNDAKIDDKSNDDGEIAKKRVFSKFMTKGQFALLSDDEKGHYLEQFKTSSHREHIPRVRSRPSRIEFDASDMTDEEAESFHEQLMRELDEVGAETKASINSESIGAANDVTDDDMKESGEDIKNNAESIADDVAKRFANQPGMLKKGLAGLRKIWGGAARHDTGGSNEDGSKTDDEKKEDQDRNQKISLREKQITQDTITRITKFAMMGTGILALCVIASPAAFVIAALLMEGYGKNEEKNDRSKDDAHEDTKTELEREKKRNKTMADAEKDRKAQIKARQKALIEEQKRIAQQKEETEKSLEDQAEKNSNGEESDDAEKDDAEKEEPIEPTEQDDAEEESDDLKVAASAQDEFEYSHEDDHNTLVELIKHIGTHLENQTGDDLRNNMRVAYGKRANMLVSNSSDTVFESIEALASALDGVVQDDFVVTASARYDYSKTTGRYGHAKD